MARGQHTLDTQVAIVGAGPAGLMLSHLLHLQGIDSVVLETRSREYVQQRVRAGVLEQGTADLLRETGVRQRLDNEGIVHHGLELRFDGAAHRIPLTDLTGRSIWIHGQAKVVDELIDTRLSAGGQIVFEVSDVNVHEPTSETPYVRFRADDEDYELRADVIAGCDGSHGVCAASIPAGEATLHERDYPFGWLGVLAEVPPSTDELIYCSHERGFALHSLRSPELSRIYLQVDPNDDIANWPDDRIWAEMQTRFSVPNWSLKEGPIIEKNITPMRGSVVDPMQYGRLFLAGDSAHVVPPTGAKGLNLAINDVKVLAEALTQWYGKGRTDLLDAYSQTCLRRVWRVQQFSWWMTAMLHRAPNEDSFDHHLRHSQLRYVASSRAAATTLAENYVGLAEI